MFIILLSSEILYQQWGAVSLFNLMLPGELTTAPSAGWLQELNKTNPYLLLYYGIFNSDRWPKSQHSSKVYHQFEIRIYEITLYSCCRNKKQYRVGSLWGLVKSSTITQFYLSQHPETKTDRIFPESSLTFAYMHVLLGLLIYQNIPQLYSKYPK